MSKTKSKPRSHHKKSVSLKARLLPIAALVALAAVAVGSAKLGRHVWQGMAHLSAGQCFNGKKTQVLGRVESVIGDKYVMTLLIPTPVGMMPRQGSVTIRSFNEQADPELVDCSTGEKLK